MSDEAFARRFYSDRAELTGLGVPLTSQRDEFTGEELYTLRSEHYFLDRLDLDDDELAALQTALYLLEGKFAYAEPLRLALQNLVLGRPGFQDAPTATAERVRVTAPDYSPELAGRLSKLENAIAKQRTITFSYWSPQRDRVASGRSTRTRSASTRASGTSSARISTATPIRTFRVSRIRSDIRFATRRERDFRLPADFDVEAHRVPQAVADRRARSARRGSPCRRTPPGGSSAPSPTRERSRTASSRPTSRARAARRLGPAPERPRRPARAGGAARRGRGRLARLREAHEGDAAAARRASAASRRPATAASGRSARSRPERFGVLQALLAHLLAACGESRDARPRRRRPRVSASRSRARSCRTPLAPQPRQLRRRLLHGLRGGRRGHGRRARRQGAVRRRLPQAAEADAARGPGDPAGDRVRRPDDRRRGRTSRSTRVRKKLEETFGQFELAQTPRTASPTSRGEARAHALATRVEKRRVVEIEYLKEGEESPSDARRRAVLVRARAPVLARAHVGPDGRRAADVPARPDALGAD